MVFKRIFAKIKTEHYFSINQFAIQHDIVIKDMLLQVHSISINKLNKKNILSVLFIRSITSKWFGNIGKYIFSQR